MLISRKISEIGNGLNFYDLKSKENFFLTIDTDWCHEDILLDTLSILEKYHAKATIFMTNKFDCLSYLQKNKSSYELGIHPNFNNLLEGKNTKEDSINEVIDSLMNLLPSALSIRSHSLVTSSKLTSIFYSKGLSHESNIKIPLNSGQTIYPFVHPTGMVMCPFQWGDYSDENGQPIKFKLPNYFMANFHPIHIFLNTESIGRYEQTRLLHMNPAELIKHRFKGYGVRNRLVDLLKLCVDSPE
jgi:hypothetical protein